MTRIIIQLVNDQVDGAGYEVTVFINCRIEGPDDTTMGVGYRVNSFQSLIKGYESDFVVSASLIDKEEDVGISAEYTRFEGSRNLFESCAYPEVKDSILNHTEMAQNLWYSSRRGNGFVVSRYIENLNWYLIVENDTTALNQRLAIQLLREILIES